MKDMIGNEIKVGDVVAYAATSGKSTGTRLYVIHSVKTEKARRFVRFTKPEGGVDWKQEEYDREAISLRGFKKKWWGDKKMTTYVRRVFGTSQQMIKITSQQMLFADPTNEEIQALKDHLAQNAR